MRIRKRHPPLPLSSLLPAPLPDPHLRPPPPVQLHGRSGDRPDRPAGRPPSHRHHSDPVNRPPPDLLPTPIDGGSHGGEVKVKEDQVSEQRGGEGEAKERHKDFWEANMFGGSRSTNSEVLRAWGSDGDGGRDGDGDGDGDWGGRGEKRAKRSEGGPARRGRLVEEGSRCSRMNGRGWRCCQPTLLGYSLCEHHLGKGRLRSIAAVQIRASLCDYNAVASSIAVASPGGDDDGGVRRPPNH